MFEEVQNNVVQLFGRGGGATPLCTPSFYSQNILSKIETVLFEVVAQCRGKDMPEEVNWYVVKDVGGNGVCAPPRTSSFY